MQAYTILSNWLAYIRYLLWTNLSSQEVQAHYTELFKMNATLLTLLGLKESLQLGKLQKLLAVGLLSPRMEAHFQPNSCKTRKQVPARDFPVLLALLLLSKSVKSRVNAVCLRCLCSVHSPGPASVLKIDWIGQMGNQQQSWDWLPSGTEEEVIWWAVALNCTNEGNEWGPSEVIAVFFITKWTGWKFAKGRRQLLGKALLFVTYLCYSLTCMMMLQHRFFFSFF